MAGPLFQERPGRGQVRGSRWAEEFFSQPSTVLM